MTPRWWDWLGLAVLTGGGLAWLAVDMPGLLPGLNATVPVAAPVTAPAPAAAPLAQVQQAPQAQPVLPTVQRPVEAAPAPPAANPPALRPAPPTVVTTAPAPPAAPPAEPPRSAKPPLPEVIRPSHGESAEGTIQPGFVVSNLPAVIHPKNQTESPGVGGTGFFIARDGSVMTAAHVVNACKRIVVASKHIRTTEAILLALDNAKDVAILRTIGLRPPAVFELAARPFGAESLEIFGYPAEGDTVIPTEANGRLLTERPPLNGMEQLDRADILWIDANEVRPGFSGGPVIDPNGAVIGLVNGHVTRRTTQAGRVLRDTKFVWASSTRTIDDFLGREVPTLVRDAPNAPQPADREKAIVHIYCSR
jgi:S1-C subfamily serine protease